MGAPPIRKSKLSLSQRGEIRKQRINSKFFRPEWITDGVTDDKPIFCEDRCAFINDNYREGHERVYGKQDIFKNLAK